MSELQTPSEWAYRHAVEVLDPDGWREDGKSFYEPIAEDDFLRRLSVSTIRAKTKHAIDLLNDYWNGAK